MVTENKHTFFEIKFENYVDVDDGKGDPYVSSKHIYENSLLILDILGLSEKDAYLVRIESDPDEDDVKHELNDFLLIIKCVPRKRIASIRNSLYSISDKIGNYKLRSLTKHEKISLILELRQDKSVYFIMDPDVVHYTGDDLSFFKDKSNFYPWQKDLYDKIFDSEDNLKPIDARKIISIVDPVGKSGKSSFVKFLCYKRKDFVKLSYGTSMQLRSAILSVGPKKAYLIDLPRTPGSFDKTSDILSVIEDLKNGHLTSPMYGKYSNMLMNPPIVIVFSNTFFPFDSLSADRWDSFVIESSLNSPKLVHLGELEHKKYYQKQVKLNILTFLKEERLKKSLAQGFYRGEYDHLIKDQDHIVL